MELCCAENTKGKQVVWSGRYASSRILAAYVPLPATTSGSVPAVLCIFSTTNAKNRFVSQLPTIIQKRKEAADYLPHVDTMKQMILVTSPPACGKTFISPEPLQRLDAGHDLILFHNSSDKEFAASMKSILERLEGPQ